MVIYTYKKLSLFLQNMDEEVTGMEPTKLGGSSKYAVNYNVPDQFAG